jgi:hypothetical protein
MLCWLRVANPLIRLIHVCCVHMYAKFFVLFHSASHNQTGTINNVMCFIGATVCFAPQHHQQQQ